MGHQARKFTAVLVSFSLVWSTYLSPALADWRTFLFGDEFAPALALLFLPEVDSPDLQSVVDNLRALAGPATEYEQQHKTPASPGDDQAREQLKSARDRLNHARDSLNAFNQAVARGDYDAYLKKDFWAKCNTELGNKISAVEKSGLGAADDPSQLHQKKAPPPELKRESFAAIESCRGRAAELSGVLQMRIAEFDAKLGSLDTQLADNEQQFKDHKITAEERDRIKQALDKEKATTQQQKQDAQDAKRGVDVWLVISGVVMIAAGVVLVFCYDFPDGWALVAGGIGMVTEGLGNGGGEKPSGSNVATSSNGPGSGGQAQTSSDDANKVKDGVAGGKAGQDTKAVEAKFTAQGFAAVSSATPGGNLVLFYNKATKELLVARADNSADLLRISLQNVDAADGDFWPKDLHLLDLQQPKQWAIKTAKGYVVLSFLGTFPGGDFSVALIENKAKRYVAVNEVAPKPVLATK